MKAVKVKRPKYYWANYSWRERSSAYGFIEIRVYKESTSLYEGKTYYHHRHLFTMKFQVSDSIIKAYGQHFEFENNYDVEDALRLMTKLVKNGCFNLKGTLKQLKKLGIPKYIYSSNGNMNFLPYQWRNDEKLYFKLLG